MAFCISQGCLEQCQAHTSWVQARALTATGALKIAGFFSIPKFPKISQNGKHDQHDQHGQHGPIVPIPTSDLGSHNLKRLMGMGDGDVLRDWAAFLCSNGTRWHQFFFSEESLKQLETVLSGMDDYLNRTLKRASSINFCAKDEFWNAPEPITRLPMSRSSGPTEP